MTPRLLSAFSMFGIVGVLIIAFASTRAVTPDSFPDRGFPVEAEIHQLLPEGGKLLVVSEACEVCVERAKAITTFVARHEGHVLLVGTMDDTVRVPEFQDFLTSHRTRSQVLRIQNLRDALQLRSTPALIEIDAAGRVVEAGPASVGWLRSFLSPRKWIGAWLDLGANVRERLSMPGKPGLGGVARSRSPRMSPWLRHNHMHPNRLQALEVLEARAGS